MNHDTTQIKVDKRQRTEMDASKLVELKESIAKRGLLHPIIINVLPDETKLVVGERRLRAVEALHKEGREFRHAGKVVEKGFIPATKISELSAFELLSIEFDENQAREDFSWQDRDRALAAIHEARVALNPKQTIRDTANALLEDGKVTSAAGQPIASDGALRRSITEAQVVARNLDVPAVAKARNHNEAFQIAMAHETRAHEAELVRRKLKKAEDGLTIKLIHGSALDVLPTLDDGFVDLIFADPPYGLNAGNAGFRERTVHHHNYDDTPENARRIMQAIIEQGWRVSKPEGANLFLFSIIDHWEFWKAACSNMGWVPWGRPVIWQKSKSEGLAPWGSQGFRYTYDMIFWATKGKKGLISSPVDILSFNRVPRNERTYAAEKPIDLLSLIIQAATLPGDVVLDPTAGSGSTIRAARLLKRHAIGIEIDQSAHELSTINVWKEEEHDNSGADTAVDTSPESLV